MVLSLPIQSRRVMAEIDLIDQRQVLVALWSMMDFIDSDGVDGNEGAMRQSAE